MFYVFLSLLLAVQTSAAGSASLVLEGTLVDKARRPTAGRTVFSFPITENGQVIRFPGISSDGYLLTIEPDAHPHARTDANGRFRIAYGKVTAADLTGDGLLLTGMQHPGVTVGVFRRENLRAAKPEDENPFLLVPAPGSPKPTITRRGGSIVVHLGTLMLPDKSPFEAKRRVTGEGNGLVCNRGNRRCESLRASRAAREDPDPRRILREAAQRP